MLVYGHYAALPMAANYRQSGFGFFMASGLGKRVRIWAGDERFPYAVSRDVAS